LESLFRDGKIIPNAIPSFLKDVLKLKYLESAVVDLDVDIPLLYDRLHEKAMECLESLDKEVIQKGKDYLLSMVQLLPDNNITLYNLACADSLLNNVNEALQNLEKAVRAGYSNVEHMLKDQDLKNIKETEGFKKIIEMIENIKNGKINNSNVNESQCVSQISDSSFYQVSMNEDCPSLDDEDNDPVVLDMNNLDSVVFDEKNETTNIPDVEVKVPILSDSFIDIRLKWADKIELIKGMGFSVDDEVLSLLLEQSAGDHEKVVNLLLQKSF